MVIEQIVVRIAGKVVLEKLRSLSHVPAAINRLRGPRLLAAIEAIGFAPGEIVLEELAKIPDGAGPRR